MIPKATVIRLDRKTRIELEGWLRASTTEQRMARRARIVLLAADGWASRAIGRKVGVMTGVVSVWRTRFAASGIDGLKDKPRPGAKPVYTEGNRQAHSGRARSAGADCVDEKPSIQALERAQGYLKLPNGRALTGHSHDYKRHGTSTLFAAFAVATGKIKAAHKKRRRRKEFLDFMDDVVAHYPGRRLKVILDNLNTHKKNNEWLARHPKVTFHYTPTRASWLNQLEGWFSILQGQSLNGASFTSVAQLREHIDAFIETYNAEAEPFAWTKSKVHQRRVKGRRISEL